MSSPASRICCLSPFQGSIGCNQPFARLTVQMLANPGFLLTRPSLCIGITAFELTARPDGLRLLRGFGSIPPMESPTLNYRRHISLSDRRRAQSIRGPFSRYGLSR